MNDTTEVISRDVAQAVVNEMFPIGYVLLLFEDQKSLWRNTEWVKIEEGQVLVAASGRTGTFPIGGTGGAAQHRHNTQGYVLTVQQIPSHCHAARLHEWCYNVYGTSQLPAFYGQNRIRPMDNSQNIALPSSDYTGGNQSHNHGETTYHSSYPPYVCVTFWRGTK
jgi:hypothetical protein